LTGRTAGENPHVHIDRRSFALHQLVATKLEADPGVLEIARANIARWRSLGHREVCLDAWEAILAGGQQAVVRFLRSSGQRATRLRQSSPFVGVLSADERDEVFRAFRERGA